MRRAAIVVLALAFPASAHAVDLSPAGQQVISGSAAAGAAAGATTVTWAATGLPQQGAVRAQGSATFGTAQTVITPPANSGPPLFAYGSGGHVAAAFVVNPGIPHKIMVALRAPGEAQFAAAQTVAVSTGDQVDPQLVVGADGDVTVFWQEGSGPRRLRAARRAPGAGAFAPAVDVSGPADDSLNASAAIDAQGGIVVAWARVADDRRKIEGARRPPGTAAFTAPVTLSGGAGGGFDPDVAVSPQGDATVAWEDLGGAAVTTVQAATWPAGASGAVDRQVLSGVVDAADHPQVAVSPSGDVTVVWERAVAESGGGGMTIFREDNIRAAFRAAEDPAFGAAKDVSVAGTGASSPVVVAGPQGNVTVAWRSADATFQRVYVSTRGASADAFSPQEPVSEGGANASVPVLAVDAVGDATVAWVRNQVAQATVLDTGGPSLDELVIPETAQVGVPFSVSVNPHDARSALGTTTWRFGDGGTATGNSATHSYPAPGSYLVRVTATDEHGIATSASRRITVPAPPAAAAPPGATTTPADRIAPVLTKVSIKAVRRRPTLKLTSSEAGTLRATFSRRAGKRLRRVRTSTAKVRRGANTLKLPRLARGRYRVAVVVVDAAGNRSRTTTKSLRV